MIRNDKDFILKNIAGESMLFPIGDKKKDFQGAIVLNELSAFVWELLKAEMTFDEILSVILTVYDVEQEQAKTELEWLLNKFLEFEGILFSTYL